SPPGVLCTIPSRYGFTIGQQEVFRLTRCFWQIHTRLHEPRTTRATHHGNNTSFNYGTITLYGQASTPIRLPASSTAMHGSTTQAHPTTPTTQPLPGITPDRPSLIRVLSALLTG